MTNAAIYFHPDGYDTSGARLMGRHSAGESFLRGLLRHAEVDRFHFYDAAGGDAHKYNAFLSRIEPHDKPVRWIARRGRSALSDPGCLYVPMPSVGEEAWKRRPLGSRTYSLCGITHTTSTHRAMDMIADLAHAPVEPWDALICTSAAVRNSVEIELAAVREDLASRLGATRFPTPQLATIPLGINTSDFERSELHRKAWREKLGIPEDAICALYVGRLDSVGKMNPASMALALEGAARHTGRELYWIVSGWGETLEVTETFHSQTSALCPSIQYRSVDGRPADTRFSIWSAGDFFLSFSDNVQETFGLTPAEAMAAELPTVVSDWNGYRETVRHGVDGFRIATYAPRAGLGRDLAYAFASEWTNYGAYLANAAQVTAVDLRLATEAIVTLVSSPELRARMGRAARDHARATLDWSAIIPQYQALWAELHAKRAATSGAPETDRRDNPRRLDPFQLFASYPTEALSGEHRLGLAAGMSWDLALARLTGPLGQLGNASVANKEELATCYGLLERAEAETVAAIIAKFPAGRAPIVERSLLHLAKHGIVEIRPRAEVV